MLSQSLGAPAGGRGAIDAGRHVAARVRRLGIGIWPLFGPRPPGTSAAAVSVSLRGKRRSSDVDVERARLLHQYALHRFSADAQRLADLQYAGAALVEAQEALL